VKLGLTGSGLHAALAAFRKEVIVLLRSFNANDTWSENQILFSSLGDEFD
jgi:hypothetical protein